MRLVLWKGKKGLVKNSLVLMEYFDDQVVPLSFSPDGKEWMSFDSAVEGLWEKLKTLSQDEWWEWENESNPLASNWNYWEVTNQEINT